MGSKNAMANYLRRISSKEGGGGGGRANNKPNDHQGHCKKHPKHRQSPGVCSLCLGEKLSQLSRNNTKKTTIHIHDEVVGSNSCSSSSSLSSYYSSSSATSCSSPMHGYRFGSTERKGGGASLTLLLFSGKNTLTKSRSVAFASRMRGKEVVDDKKKKDGFLSKLLHPRRGAHHQTSKKEVAAPGLAHSRTMKASMVH